MRFRRTGATKDSKRRARRERRRRRARDRSATMARDDVASQRDDARKRREKRRELRTAIDAARVNQEELQKPECDDLERAVDAADDATNERNILGDGWFELARENERRTRSGNACA